MIRAAAIVLLAASFAAPALAQEFPRPAAADRFEGLVVAVPDGDGLVVRTPRGPVEVRLQGIDAPERDQACEAGGRPEPCGRIAADALRELALGRRARCETPADDPVDGYGRALAFCAVDGYGRALAMLEAGRAVVFRRFVAEHPREGRRRHADAFLAAESRARAARRGLWAGRFDMPWDWRAGRR
jgi:endonuclease YncB( thermonuclease family)